MKFKVIFIDKKLEEVFNKLDDEDPIKKALIRAALFNKSINH